jgi:hypothetical protein
VFTGLRLWARVLLYVSSLLSIVSGAVSFTVVPAIVLSVLSAAAQVRGAARGRAREQPAPAASLKAPAPRPAVPQSRQLPRLLLISALSNPFSPSRRSSFLPLDLPRSSPSARRRWRSLQSRW